MLPGRAVGVALGVLAAVVLGVAVVQNPLAESLAALLGGHGDLAVAYDVDEVHTVELLVGRDVEQRVTARTVAVEVLRLIHGEAVASAGESVVDHGDRRAHPVVPVARRGVGGLNHQAVRHVELGEAELAAAVRVARIVVLPVGIGHGGSAVVHGLGVTEGVAGPQVQTEVETLLEHGGQGVGIALVRVLQVDNAVVVAAAQGVVGRTGGLHSGHGVDLLAVVDQGEVFEEDVVERLGVNALNSHLHVAGQHLLKGQVGAEHLRVLEVLAHGDDVGRSGRALLGRGQGVVLILLERGDIGVLYGDLLHVDARIVEGVAQPDEWDAAGEDADAATQQRAVAAVRVPVEAYAGRHHQLRAGRLAYLDAHVVGGCEGVELVVSHRVVEDERDVEAQAVGQVKVVVGHPLVLSVETELAGLERGGVLQAPGDVGVRIGVAEAPGVVVEKVLDGVEAPLAVGSLEEEVADAVELVVRTERKGVIAQIPGEVVLKGVDVLIQGVGAGGILRADVDVVARGAVRTVDIADGDGGAVVSHLAEIADEGGRSAQLVIDVVRELRVQLSHHRVSLVIHAVAGIDEEVLRRAGAVAVAVGVVVLITQGQLVPVVDVPVQAGQQAE